MCRLPPTFLLPKLLHLVLTLSAWIFLIQAKLHKAQLGEGEIILQMIAKQTLATQTKGSSLPDLPLLSLCLSLSLPVPRSCSHLCPRPHVGLYMDWIGELRTRIAQCHQENVCKHVIETKHSH